MVSTVISFVTGVWASQVSTKINAEQALIFGILAIFSLAFVSLIFPPLRKMAMS